MLMQLNRNCTLRLEAIFVSVIFKVSLIAASGTTKQQKKKKMLQKLDYNLDEQLSRD
jgi:hypothetical protein